MEERRSFKITLNYEIPPYLFWKTIPFTKEILFLFSSFVKESWGGLKLSIKLPQSLFKKEGIEKMST